MGDLGAWLDRRYCNARGDDGNFCFALKDGWGACSGRHDGAPFAFGQLHYIFKSLARHYGVHFDFHYVDYRLHYKRHGSWSHFLLEYCDASVLERMHPGTRDKMKIRKVHLKLDAWFRVALHHGSPFIHPPLPRLRVVVHDALPRAFEFLELDE